MGKLAATESMRAFLSVANIACYGSNFIIICRLSFGSVGLLCALMSFTQNTEPLSLMMVEHLGLGTKQTCQWR